MKHKTDTIVILQTDHNQSQLYRGCVLGNSVTRHEEYSTNPTKHRQFVMASRPVTGNIYIREDIELHPVGVVTHRWLSRWIQYTAWSFPLTASALKTLIRFRNPINVTNSQAREEGGSGRSPQLCGFRTQSFHGAACIDTAASCRCIRNSTETC